MFKPLSAVLAVALTVTTVQAQTATFVPFGTTCKASALTIVGLPKLGTTFTVKSISFPSICTRKSCGCNVGKCNTTAKAPCSFSASERSMWGLPGRLSAPRDA